MSTPQHPSDDSDPLHAIAHTPTDAADGQTRPSIMSLGMAADPLAEMRHPLTALMCVLPLVLIGELFRIVTQKNHSLLADDLLSRLAANLAIDLPLLPACLLFVVCLLWTVGGRYKWTFPNNFVLWRVAYWSLIWASLRCLISFTSDEVHSDSVQLFGTIGTCMSAASQEELFFRALCIGAGAWLLSLFYFSRHTAQWVLLVPSTLLFALAHTYIMNRNLSPADWDNAYFIELIAAGALYGYIYIRQGLAVSCLSHFAYNVIVITGVLL